MLCKGYPTEFLEYFRSVMNLGFEDRPDYAYLRNLFRELFTRRQFVDDGEYDWIIVKKQQGAKPPVVGLAQEGPMLTARSDAAAISSSNI